MYYRAKQYSKKVQKRIMRHKRTRYHNDAVLFSEETYSDPRKRTIVLNKRDKLNKSGLL